MSTKLLFLLLLPMVGTWWLLQDTTVPPLPSLSSGDETEVEVSRNTDQAARAGNATADSEAEVIAQYYAPLYPMQIGSVPVQASLARTAAEIQQGLSGTPFLPESVVKVFVFNRDERWSFWMKDMNYAIDMIWLDVTGRIVHIESSVSPATYPETFLPPVPARYVVETVAGFSAQHNITVGTQVTLPAQI